MRYGSSGGDNHPEGLADDLGVIDAGPAVSHTLRKLLYLLGFDAGVHGLQITQPAVLLSQLLLNSCQPLAFSLHKGGLGQLIVLFFQLIQYSPWPVDSRLERSSSLLCVLVVLF